MLLLTVIDLFAGAGGLSEGFRNEGYKIVAAVEKDKYIVDTYSKNHPKTLLIREDIKKITLPYKDIDVLIGGPPCQSWSIAGAKRGLLDKRGQLVNDYIRILNVLKPKAFVLENVPGIRQGKNLATFTSICTYLEKECKYKISFGVLNGIDFGLAQSRKRLFLIGIKKDIGVFFDFTELEKSIFKVSLYDALKDLPDPLPALNNKANEPCALAIPNHEYKLGNFSSHYMSRNRRRAWDEVSFTIPASSRHIPIHPNAKPMIKIGKDLWSFDTSYSYRRFSVRECARIQGFSDKFVFLYNNIDHGYRMVGNAVPPPFAQAIAKSLKKLINK